MNRIRFNGDKSINLTNECNNLLRIEGFVLLINLPENYSCITFCSSIIPGQSLTTPSDTTSTSLVIPLVSGDTTDSGSSLWDRTKSGRRRACFFFSLPEIHVKHGTRY